MRLQILSLDPTALMTNGRTISANEWLKELQCAHLMNKKQSGDQKLCASDSMKRVYNVSFREYIIDSVLTSFA
jgi:hypothetical protein